MSLLIHGKIQISDALFLSTMTILFIPIWGCILDWLKNKLRLLGLTSLADLVFQRRLVHGLIEYSMI